MSQATQVLRNEHEEILHVLKIMNKLAESDQYDDEEKYAYGLEFIYFLNIFVDQCHHGKEEKFLFKALEKNGVTNEGGPIGIMLAEHAQGRAYIQALQSAIEAKDIRSFTGSIVDYCMLMGMHIEKENKLLFVIADERISPHKQDVLIAQFEGYEEEIIGPGVHEKLQVLIGKWSEEFGIE